MASTLMICAKGTYTIQNIVVDADSVKFDVYFQSSTAPGHPCHNINYALADISVLIDIEQYEAPTFSRIEGSEFPASYLYSAVFDASLIAAPAPHLDTNNDYFVVANLLQIAFGLHPVVQATPIKLARFAIDGFVGSADPDISISLDGGFPSLAFTYDTIGNFLYNVDLLPDPMSAEVLSFTARSSQNRDAFLRWTTASEVNVAHYEIQRSQDNTVTWTLLRRINAKGTEHSAHQSYTYLDTDINLHTRGPVQYFYRLQIVDYDGSSEYSEVCAARFAKETGMDIFPNPATDQLYFQFGELENLGVPPQITIFNSLGSVIYSGKISGDAYIDLADLGIRPGLYLVCAEIDDRSALRQKILISTKP